MPVSGQLKDIFAPHHINREASLNYQTQDI